MAYIDNALIRGETVIARASISWWAMLPTTILAVILMVTVFLAPVGIILLIGSALRIWSTELAITNKRVIAKFGLVRRNTVELRLDRIEGLRVNQGIFGRIFNYGSIVVSGTGVTQAPIPAISNPMDFRRLCLEASDDATRSVEPAAKPDLAAA
jgi:uncharacterized membrane protein YdbT with pleckstrin-like domain